MLVQFLAPLRRPDACRDAGYEWRLDNRVEGFEYCADYSRKAGYLRRCSHTSTGEVNKLTKNNREKQHSDVGLFIQTDNFILWRLLCARIVGRQGRTITLIARR